MSTSIINISNAEGMKQRSEVIKKMQIEHSCKLRDNKQYSFKNSLPAYLISSIAAINTLPPYFGILNYVKGEEFEELIFMV